MAYLDTNGLTRVWQKIKTLLNGKVDKVNGMGLSEENYSSNDKASLESMQDGMEFLISFGKIATNEGSLVIGNGDTLHTINAKIISYDNVEDRDNVVMHTLRGEIADAILACQSYTDVALERFNVASSESNGLMSSSDKKFLDELRNAWENSSFLTVSN